MVTVTVHWFWLVLAALGLIVLGAFLLWALLYWLVSRPWMLAASKSEWLQEQFALDELVSAAEQLAVREYKAQTEKPQSPFSEN